MATHRILWSQEEAAILLDCVIRTNGSPKREDIQTVSDELRKLAVISGVMTQSELSKNKIYRNTNGVAMHYYILLYEWTRGRKGLKGKASWAENIVSLHRHRPQEYKALLQKTKLKILCCKPAESEASIKNIDANEKNEKYAIAPSKIDEPIMTSERRENDDENIAEPKKDDTTSYEKFGVYHVDFANCDISPTAYAFTRPIYCKVFGVRYDESKWTGVYVRVLSALHKSRPNDFMKLVKKFDGDNGELCFADEANMYRMRVPRLIANNIYAETNRSATDIVLHIEKFMRLCGVDYRDIDIVYEMRKNKRSAAAQSNIYPVKPKAEKDKPKISVTLPDNDAIGREMEAFANWLRRAGYSDVSVCSYLVALRECGSFAEMNEDLFNNIWLVKEKYRLESLRNSLVKARDFRHVDDSEENMLLPALEQYILYRSGEEADVSNISWQEKLRRSMERDTQEPPEQARSAVTYSEPHDLPYGFVAEEKRTSDNDTPKISADEKERLKEILRDEFHDGYRLGSVTARKRFAIFYKNRFGNELDIDSLDKSLASIGSVRDNRVFMDEGNEVENVIQNIVSEINRLYDDGNTCIYLASLFGHYQSALADVKIYDLNTMFNEIKKTEKNLFIDGRGIIEKRGLYASPEKDFIKYIKSQFVPVHIEKMESDLWQIKNEKIKSMILQDARIVNVATRTYYYAPNLPLDETEKNRLTNALQEKLLAKNLISDDELADIISRECPSFAADTSDFATSGLKKVLAYYLGDKFHFQSKAITRVGASISGGNIYREYCERFRKMSLDDIHSLERDTEMRIDWNAVQDVMVRVSDDEFVRRSDVHFNVAAIDSALDKMIAGDYLPISKIMMLQLPAVSGIAWNPFVLESYVYKSSRDFHLVHRGFTENGVVGAIVRNDVDISDYSDLLVDVLAHAGKWRDASSAAAYLVDEGYRQRVTVRGSFRDIVSEAKKKREKIKIRE